jgi:hypothetical protein
VVNDQIFDNGAFRHGESFQFSRGIEIDRETKKIVWEWSALPKVSWPIPHRHMTHLQESFYSPFMGSAQRLPNGNTLLCESACGRLIEINTKNEVCWEYVCPYFSQYPEPAARDFFPAESNALFRAYKYAPEEIPWL